MRKFIKVFTVVTRFLSLSLLLLLFQSCQEEDYLHIKNETSVKLKHNETHKIQAESLSSITYQSENLYIANVDNYGYVRANYIGSTSIRLYNESGIENYVKVNVIPKSNLYPEPNISFGDTKYNVKSKLGVPDQEKTDAFLYTDYSTNAPYLLVTFEYGQVSSYAVLVNDYLYPELTNRFLAERYKYMGYIDNIRTYIDALTLSEAKKTIAVGLYEDANYNYYEQFYLVGYLDNNNTRSSIDTNCLKTALSTMFK